MENKKKCTKCRKMRVITSFGKNKSTKDGLSYWCKKCCAICRKGYYKKEGKEKKRRYFLKKRYGITVEQYNKILKQQNYKCAICNRHQSVFARKLDVDHNHRTLYVRGLLCRYCNSRLLRYLRDSKKNAMGLIKYLSKALNDDKDWKYDNV